MTPRQRANLLRLLKPRHIAVIGGRDAQTVAMECRRIGYDGPIWPINPARSEMAGYKCFSRVEDLPDAPDAVFIAVPRDTAIDILGRLDAMGAGGVVCYTAGFGETGQEGAYAEAQLVAAAGDMALIGPNCYGLINYIDKVALWPFAHGGTCPGYGAAIITQSGMLSSDLTMSQRSTPFAYMISAGNQSVLHLEDFVDVLCEKPEVRAIGLHVEGLRNVAAFEVAARKALERGIPIIALKTGTSAIGAELAVSHTGSLSGTDDLFNALFERLAIIRVDNPSQFLETLKFVCVAGLPKGKAIVGFTCSGGGATMLADHAENIGLALPRPRPETAKALRECLPQTATVSNPLDYTTPIWGDAKKTGPVFETFLRDGYDAAVLVQDYPAAGLDDGKQMYLNDAGAFVSAAAGAGAGVPACICSTLPENMDRETREQFMSLGVAPMQGLNEALNAVKASALYASRRGELLAQAFIPLNTTPRPRGDLELVDEAAAKLMLSAAGIPVPEGRAVSAEDARDISRRLGYPVVLKMTGPHLAHKTEAGAVCLNLETPAEVGDAVSQMRRDVAAYNPEAVTDTFLVERMIAQPVCELMVSVRQDEQFGFAMTLASGGIFVELVGDVATVLLPTVRSEISAALDRLRATRLIDGFRGRPVGDRECLLDTLERLADYVCSGRDAVTQVEINPLFILQNEVCAVDVLMYRAAS